VTAGIVGMLVIVVMAAWIAKLLGRSWIAVGLVLLLGAMLAQSPGVLGDMTGGTADFTQHIPANVARIFS
jgi:hypothetical protein